jgi:hypothetical protein
MKKSYVTPSIDKIQMDSQVIRMISKQGFIEVFWEELALQRKTKPDVSREAVFDCLNRKYYEVLGSFRYSSYDSFRQRINE